MLLLGIETSTSRGSLALVQDSHLVCQRVFTRSLGHSEKLIPACHGLLKAAKVTLPQLDGIAVGIGPGSYTGMRVALAAAQGLAYVHAIPIVGVPSLDALVLAHTRKIPNGVQKFYALVDAKRNETYVGEYQRRKDGFVRKGKIHIVPNAQIQKWHQEGIFLCGQLNPHPTLSLKKGEGCESKSPSPLKRERAGVRVTTHKSRATSHFFPTAAAVAILGEKQLKKGKPASLPKPIYIRPFAALKSKEHKWIRNAAVGLKSI